MNRANAVGAARYAFTVMGERFRAFQMQEPAFSGLLDG